jgi:hypothetical protein
MPSRLLLPPFDSGQRNAKRLRVAGKIRCEMHGKSHYVPQTQLYIRHYDIFTEAKNVWLGDCQDSSPNKKVPHYMLISICLQFCNLVFSKKM